MAKGFKHGAGGGSIGLNFEIVPYATEEELIAATPKENTIGVITSDAITSWVFSATEPTEPTEGMVWIVTGKYCTTEFNALKKNSLMTYPIDTKQYVGGVWVGKTAKIYQGSAWADWWNGQLYDKGYEFDSITGGWGEVKGSGTCTVTHDDSSITITINNGSGCVRTNNKIDISGYSKVEITLATKTHEHTGRQYLSLTKDSGYSSGSSHPAYLDIGNKAAGTYSLDISGLEDGEYHIGVYIYSVSTAYTYPVTFDSIRLT